MKNLFYLIIFFVIIGCSTNKVVYWCGDHPCINKKEKEAYFKKTMVVEMKELKKTNINNNSEIEKIIQQAKLDEKQRIKQEKDLVKQAKLEEKRRIREEKNLAKQIQEDEKQRIKQEKDVVKQAKLEEKMIESEEKLKEQASLEVEELEKQSAVLSVSEKCNHHIINARPNMQRRAKITFKDCLRKESLMTPELIAALEKDDFSQKDIVASDKISTDEASSKEFNKLVEKIKRKNSLRPYPDINDIPN